MIATPTHLGPLRAAVEATSGSVIDIGHRGPITFVWDQENKRTCMEAYDQIKDILRK